MTQKGQAAYPEFEADIISWEWVRPVKPHKTSDIILYCHGGLKYKKSLSFGEKQVYNNAMTNQRLEEENGI